MVEHWRHFENHLVVTVDVQGRKIIYDPSYGEEFEDVTKDGAEDKWRTKSLEGFQLVYRLTAEEPHIYRYSPAAHFVANDNNQDQVKFSWRP